MSLRADLAIISQWIKPESHLLDLGCGDGVLLKYMQETRDATGYGFDISHHNIVECIKNNVNVVQRDLDQGLADFDSNSFDYVIMTQTIQAINHPLDRLKEMLRVGREGIVTFPNFGHWRSRSQLLFHGRMPVAPAIPAQWYDTDNVHLCTITDFEKLCVDNKIEVLQREVVDRAHNRDWLMQLFPNFLGEIALYRLRRR